MLSSTKCIICVLSLFFRKVYGNYVAILLISAIMNAVALITIKLLGDHNSAFQILFFRSIFIVAVLGVSIHRKDGKYFGEKEVRYFMFLRVLWGTVSYVLYTFATLMLPLVDSTFLLNIYPVSTAVISFLLKLERPTFQCWVGVFACCVGIVIFAEPPFIFGGDDDDWDLQRVAGYLTALAGQALRAYTFVYIRRMGELASATSNAFSQSLAILAISIPFLPTSFTKPFNYTPSLADVGLYVLMAVSSLGFQIFLARGFQTGSAVKGSIICLSTVIYSALFGILVRSDDTSVWTFVGAGILMLSVILVVVSRGEKAPVHEEPESLLNNDQEPFV